MSVLSKHEVLKILYIWHIIGPFNIKSSKAVAQCDDLLTSCQSTSDIRLELIGIINANNGLQ
jgi:hypothetical protein